MQAAREDVQQVLDNLADSRAAAGVEVVPPILDVAVAELLERVAAVARSVEDGGRAYVGSTSDPAWRWIGGWSWRGSWMDGHCLRWRQLIVLGAWPDREAGAMEVAAMRAARRLLGDRLANALEAEDARGLEVRGLCAHSFVYFAC